MRARRNTLGRVPTIRITKSNAWLADIERVFYWRRAEPFAPLKGFVYGDLVRKLDEQRGGRGTAVVASRSSNFEQDLGIARKIKAMVERGDKNAQKVVLMVDVLGQVGDIAKKVQQSLALFEKKEGLTQRQRAMMRYGLRYANEMAPHMVDNLFGALHDAATMVGMDAKDINETHKRALKTPIKKRIDLLLKLILRVQNRVVDLHPELRKRFDKRTYCALVGGKPNYKQVTAPERYRFLDAVVIAELGHGKKLFCDVACGMEVGAEATISSKQLFQRFGLQIDVHGVDIVVPENFRELQRDVLKQAGVKLFQADYLHHRLPRNYDVIRVGNLSQYLHRRAFRRTFSHLFESLNPNGLLLVESIEGGTRIYKKQVINGKEALVPFTPNAQKMLAAQRDPRLYGLTWG